MKKGQGTRGLCASGKITEEGGWRMTESGLQREVGQYSFCSLVVLHD